MIDRFIQWPQGHGWFVISGGHASGSPIRAQALERAIADGSVVYISLADDMGDDLMDDMEDLGAPAGYLVDIRHPGPSTALEIRDASVIVIEIGDSVDDLMRVLQGPVADSIKWAFERGAIVLLEGEAASPFGRWLISDAGQLMPGLDWFMPLIVVPAAGGLSATDIAQAVLSSLPQGIVVGIAVGSALAFGPDRQIELWGEADVSLALGSMYTKHD